MKNFTLKKMLALMVLTFAIIGVGQAQVKKTFTPRSSVEAPGESMFTVKGDFLILGNTNMIGQPYNDTLGNNNLGVAYTASSAVPNMRFVDVDGDASTLNSSSAMLTYPAVSGVDHSKTKVAYAGLYWMTRSEHTALKNGDRYAGYTLSVSNTTSGGYTTERFTFDNGNASQRVVLNYRYTTSSHSDCSMTATVNGSTTGNLLDGANALLYYEANASGTGAYARYRSNVNQYTITGGTINFAVRFVTDDGKIYVNNLSDKSLPLNGRTLYENVAKLKHDSESSYQTVTAAASEIYYPNYSQNGNYFINVSYAEVTDYVRAHGAGNYTVADLCLAEGPDFQVGYTGGWGMVVIYENENMTWRNVSVFDGYAVLTKEGTNQVDITLNGFKALSNGNVKVKLGMMAAEGDVRLTGDRVSLQKRGSSSFGPLHHSGNVESNFFNGSIVTGGNTRNPNYKNNCGIDICMFDIDNTGNQYIENNQTQATFRFYTEAITPGATVDVYVPYNFVLGVDAQVLEIISLDQTWQYDGTAHENPSYLVIYGNDTIPAIPSSGGMQFEVSTGNILTISNPNAITYVSQTADKNNTFDYTLTNPSAIPQVGIRYGKLSITPRPAVITADDNGKVYDATPLTDDGWMDTPPTGIVTGDNVTAVTVTGSITNVGTTANVPSNAVIMNGAMDVTDNYDITYVNGTLEITPRPLTIFADSDIKMYDGTPLTDNGWNDTPPTGLAVDDSITTVTVTGSITNVGSTTNVPSGAVVKNADDEDVTSNYTITYVNGTLRITPRTGVIVTVQEHSAEYNFDGTPKTDSGFDVVSIYDPVNIYTDHDFSFAPESDSIVTKIPVGIYDMTVVPGDFTNLNTNYESVTFIVLDGQLKIYDSLELVSTVLVDVTCYEVADGQATITIKGGKPVDPQYTYTLDGGADATTNSPLTLTGLAAGDHSVVFTDALGYSRTVNFTIAQPELLKVAITTPTALCPNQTTYPVSATATGGNGGYHYVWSDDATDVDDAATTVAQVGTTDCGHEYTATVVVTDAKGCTATDTKKFTVVDNEVPTFTRPADITIYKDAACNYDASVAVTGDVTDEADNCSTGIEATYTDADVTPATACQGTKVIERTWSLVDKCGNAAADQVQTITVLDNLAPAFDLPADTTICRNSTTGEIEAPTTLTGVPTNLADNCTAVATLEANTTFVDLDTLPAANNANRIIRREWTVTDDCGNATSQIQKITVRPSILTPGNYEFTCPTDVHVVLPYNECDMFVNIGFPEFMNHMIGMNVIIDNNAPAGSIFPEGTHIVTWTATDECGASLKCEQLVVVEFPPCGTPSDSTTDANGNRYSSVRIGCQCWTGENLRAENYFNDACDAAGNAIAVAKSYNNSDSLENVYGKLYSWYSAVGVAENDNTTTPATKTTPEGANYVQGLCPCGWAIPTQEQYQTMVTVSGGADYVKTSDNRYWLPGSEGVDPTALFKARGAGYYNADTERFEELMGTTGFWTIDNTSGSAVGTTFMITHYCQEGIPAQKLKNYNYSVRCIRME